MTTRPNYPIEIDFPDRPETFETTEGSRNQLDFLQRRKTWRVTSFTPLCASLEVYVWQSVTGVTAENLPRWQALVNAVLGGESVLHCGGKARA